MRRTQVVSVEATLHDSTDPKNPAETIEIDKATTLELWKCPVCDDENR